MNRNPKAHTSAAGELLANHKICIAVQGGTVDELFARAEAALAEGSFLELRLDSVAKPVEALARMREFATAHPEAVLIATCRRKPNGGAFRGELAEELAILHRAAQSGARIIDLELESAEEAGAEVVARLHAVIRQAGGLLLISYHDFKTTAGLEDAAGRVAAFAPDVEKVVTTAGCLADNLAVLRLLDRRKTEAAIVGIAMGEEGLVSRVLGPRAGGLFTFAASGAGVETAPGQVSVQMLRERYRIEALNAETKIYGVAGNPIHHSMSPLMQNAAFAQEKVNAVFLPLLARDVQDLLLLARELPLSGLSVTMPLKQEVLPFLTQRDKLVERIGACNTLRVGVDGEIEGFNTDAAGVVRPLRKRLELKGARVAILGAGGAARAAIFSLVDEGAEVFIVNRTHATAEAIARESGAQALRREELKMQRFDVLLNTTPCGMAGAKEALPIAPDELNAGLVFDAVYNPLVTPLIELARGRGLETVTGLEMFVEQGACQFELWTGRPAPAEAMRRVVEAELLRRG